MSDKNKMSLKDRGWSQMASVLDRELPQKKSERKPILWLFITVGILAFGFSLFINKKSRPLEKATDTIFAQKDSIKEQSNKLVIASIDTSSTDQSTALDINNNMGSAENGVIASNEIGLSIVQEVIQEKQNDDSNIRSINIDKKQVQKEMLQADSNNGIVISQTLNPTISIEKVTVVVPTNDRESSLIDIKLEELSIKELGRKQFTLERIPILSMLLIAKQRSKKDDFIALEIGETESITKPLLGENNYYVFAGSRLGLNQNGLGYQIGAGKRFGTGGFRFFAEGGFVYMNYQNEISDSRNIDLDFTPEISITTDLNEFDVNESTILKNALEQAQLNSFSLISNLNNIFLTVGIDKKITSKFNISGGFTYTRFLKLENAGVNFISSDEVFQPSLDEYNISRTSLFESEVFKKYELSTSLRLSYRLSPRFTISADYRLGLTDLIRNKFLSLSNEINTNASFNLYEYYRSIIRKDVGLRLEYNF
ncbi:MAG: hypothetical protein ACJATI_004332 [Halioglobus sp.]|jgi:hypothetical protein